MGVTLRRAWIFLFFMCVSGTYSLHAIAESAAFREFSADVVRLAPKDLGGRSKGRMYVGRMGVRTESVREGMRVWMIFRPAEKKVWTIFPDRKLYTERLGQVGRPPLPQDPESPCKKDRAFMCRSVGAEKLGNRNVQLWEIAIQTPQGPKPYARIWVDNALKVAIREHYVDGLQVTFEDIKEGPQPEGLFVLPADYTKLDQPEAAQEIKKR